MLTKYFRLNELDTSIRQEVIAGLTTFATMAYIVVVNPKILEAAGMPFGASMVATVISAFFGTLTMGLYAKRPFAIAPYMGENAFIAYTVVQVLGYSWQTAIGAIFVSGVLFTLLTIFKIRSWLANAVPETLKVAFAVGIGFFLTFIGLNQTGIVKLGVPGAPVHVGDFTTPEVQLAILGFLLIGFLMIRKVNGSMLIGILTITMLGFIFGVTPLPDKIVSMPPSIAPIFLELDILGALSWGFFAVILTIFVLDFVDTMGSLIGLGLRAGLLDDDGEFPDIEKPMLCDAVTTTVSALCGTTTAGVYVESASGIEAGGKSGLTAVVAALLFLTALFFEPFLTVVPSYAYGSALIIVGLLMMQSIARLNMDDITDVIPVFVTITLMAFTYNLGIGMTAGFVSYPLVMLVSGRIKEVHTGMYILFGLSLLFYIFYPY